jgi:hypothetical protein
LTFANNIIVICFMADFFDPAVPCGIGNRLITLSEVPVS